MKKIISKCLLTFMILASTLILTNNSVFAKSATHNESVNAISSINLINSSTIQSSTLKSWGLGISQSEYVSNNRPYSWYIDQGSTGVDSNSNCGPSSTTMALKWYNSDFTKTAIDARNTYPENDGWWTTSDVTNYLDLYSTKYSVLNNTGENLLKYKLKQGNIVVLCIDTSYISYNNNSEQRVGRFYDYKGGHFIVVKGYRVVDGKTYFETYDPNNWNAHYKDGQEKGQDRYYSSQELMNAMSNWWNYLIVVNNNSSSFGISALENNNMLQNKFKIDSNMSKIKISYGK